MEIHYLQITSRIPYFVIFYPLLCSCLIDNSNMNIKIKNFSKIHLKIVILGVCTIKTNSEANFGSTDLVQPFYPLRLQSTCFECQQFYLRMYNIFRKKNVDSTLNIRSNLQSTSSLDPPPLIFCQQIGRHTNVTTPKFLPVDRRVTMERDFYQYLLLILFM